MVMVLPIVFELAYLQDCMAKKKALIIKSTMQSSALFSRVLEVCCAIHLGRTDVMAFCDLELGNTLIIALIRSWIFVLNSDLLELSR